MSRVWILLIVIITLLGLGLLIQRGVLAITTSSVDSTVKISVCGNDVKEGGEDCDNSDYGSATCATIGYSTGILQCDSGCNYDTSLCIIIPTPTFTQTPTPTPTTQASSTNSSTSETGTQATNTPAPVVHTPTTAAVVRQTGNSGSVSESRIPSRMALFDRNGDGFVSREELFARVSNWVSVWKVLSRSKDTTGIAVDQCDINDDATCNLKDFSILLFYVEQ